MTFLTIVQASDQFKVTRAKIYRAIEKGQLSTQVNSEGVKIIQASDMVRLFGDKKPNSIKQVQTSKPIQNEQEIELLHRQLQFEREKAEFYKNQVAEIRRDYDDFKKAIGFKAYSPSPTPEQDENCSDNVLDTVQTSDIEQRNYTSEQPKEPELIKPILRGLIKRFMK